jgi:antagonist of KipI
LQPGIQTTLQDGGRWGSQRLGVPVSGAMDDFAFRMANLLVGNETCTACIEFAMGGATLVLEDSLLVAFCGKGMEIWVQGETVPLWRTALMPAGTEIKLKPVSRGSRIYMAIAGGFDVPPVLGSRSTYEPAQLGGYMGRALLANDRLPSSASLSAVSHRIINSLVKEKPELSLANWTVDFRHFPDYSDDFVRMIRGAEWEWFTDDAKKIFFGSGFTLSVQSNRMGFRMLGKPLTVKNTTELASTAVCKGTMQVTPDGSLILLMSDCQTTGGYPRIAQVAAVDLPICAQLRPNDTVAFTEVSMAEAEQLLLDREHELQQVQQNISLIFS